MRYSSNFIYLLSFSHWKKYEHLFDALKSKMAEMGLEEPYNYFNMLDNLVRNKGISPDYSKYNGRGMIRTRYIYIYIYYNLDVYRLLWSLMHEMRCVWYDNFQHLIPQYSPTYENISNLNFL